MRKSVEWNMTAQNHSEFVWMKFQKILSERWTKLFFPVITIASLKIARPNCDGWPFARKLKTDINCTKSNRTKCANTKKATACARGARRDIQYAFNPLLWILKEESQHNAQSEFEKEMNFQCLCLQSIRLYTILHWRRKKCVQFCQGNRYLNWQDLFTASSLHTTSKI